MGTSLLRAKVTGRRFPFMINWAITGRCNLRCKHCYGAYGDLQREELPADIIFRTIDQLQEMGTRRITIEGGEPLVRRDIVDIIDYINSKGMEISLCTNGILLDKYISRIYRKVDLIVLSLDGRQEYNDWLRGKGTFTKTLHAMETAAGYNVRTLVFATIIDNNINDIEYLAELIKKYRANITYNIAVAKLDAAGRNALNKVDDEQYRNVVKRIIKLKQNGYPVYYSDKNYRQALHWPDFKKECYLPAEISALSASRRKYLIPCFAGRRFAFIEANGDVYPCYQTVGTLAVKNIKTDGIRASFNHLQTLNYCQACYNLTLAELNLQADLDMGSVFKVIKNYFWPG